MARSQFIRATAGATGVALSAGLWMPLLAQADDDVAVVAPKPIPGGFQPPIPGATFVHLNLPSSIGSSVAADPSTITDFNGFVGLANVGGTGTGKDASGAKSFLFDVDVRFMKGAYVGADGERHRATFGFI